MAHAPRSANPNRKRQLEEALSKIQSFNALVTSVDAGAFHECASSIGSVATTDYKKEGHDDRVAEGKLMAENARTMANWFQLLYDDVKAGNYPAEYPTRDEALYHVDESRMELFKKFWHFYTEITTRLHPTTSEDDRVARKSAGNNLQMTLDLYIAGREKPQ